MAKGKRKKPMMLKILLILVLLGVISFCGLLAFVCIREGQVPKTAAELPEDYDAVIVLGAQVKPDGEPSVQLGLRLDRAVEVYERKQVPVVVCGAKGKDEPEAEAYTMKRYLEDKGIPGEKILTDPDSFNTEQNIRNAKEKLDELSLEIRKVIVVTSDYHVPRSMAIARDLGLDASGIGSPCLQEFWIKNHGRETLAWCKYLLKKYLHLKL
jgi:uncharacterized SAM-binding protein YcdF (DUF218 family)